MKRTRVFALATVLTLGLAACGGDEPEGGDGDATGDGAEEVVTIDFLQPLPKSMAFYPLFVSDQLGYFEEEGVRVNLLPSGDIPATVVVTAGNATIGATTPTNIVAAAAQGEDFKLVYEYYQRNVFSLIVPDDSDVQEVADLEGRTIGVTSEGSGDFALARAAVTLAGLDPDNDVTITVVGDSAPTIANSLETGRIDAFTGAFNDLVGIMAAGIELRNITPQELDELPASSMIATPGTIEELATPLEGFLRAWAKGTYAGLQNPDMVYTMAQTEVPEETGDETFGRLFLETALDLQEPLLGEDSFGAIRPEAWDAVQEQLIAGGELEEAFDSSTFLDDRFIEPANDWDRAEVEQEVEDWVAENA
jgi:NitT/TauT family transport system substrate-binding protein